MRLLRRYVRNLIMEADTGDKCPPATQDHKLNKKNQIRAMKARDIKYGHPNEIAELASFKEKGQLCGNCIAFDVSPEMVRCGGASKDGSMGYCEMHRFSCAAEKTCLTWKGGGPKK
jgi:hypothetical protein